MANFIKWNLWGTIEILIPNKTRFRIILSQNSFQLLRKKLLIEIWWNFRRHWINTRKFIHATHIIRNKKIWWSDLSWNCFNAIKMITGIPNQNVPIRSRALIIFLFRFIFICFFQRLFKIWVYPLSLRLFANAGWVSKVQHLLDLHLNRSEHFIELSYQTII